MQSALKSCPHLDSMQLKHLHVNSPYFVALCCHQSSPLPMLPRYFGCSVGTMTATLQQV